MKKDTPIIYYTDELNDEFSTAQITPKKIDKSFSYEGRTARKIGKVFFYYIIAKPLAFIFLKLKYGYKIANKDKLKACKDTGYFLYGNHTNAVADALIPTMLAHPRDVYVIVHPNNVSMPVLGRITPSLGAIPLPDTGEALRNFHKTIEHRVQQHKCVTIYPEAHIWPYYTGIRPFPKTSFGYPVMYNTPVFCFTNTYQKRGWRKTPRMVTYIEGPFYPDKTLPSGQQKQKLRDTVYDCMVANSKHSNVELIRYVKKEEQ